MKKMIFAILLFCTSYSFAQSASELDAVPLVKKEDYKIAEPMVMSTANNLLASPFDQDKAGRTERVSFIMRWMTGTPDYNFSFSANDLKPLNDNKDHLGVYITAMAKYALEHPDKAKDARAVYEGAMEQVINYCKNPDNHLPMTKGLKKLASKKGL